MSLDQLKLLIKDKPVSEIISLYVAVSRKGPQTLAVCPFHDDHDPSMNINDNKGMFFCFVDQIGGDAIKFVQLFLNVSFLEAIQDIAEKLGLNYESYIDKKENPKLAAAQYLLDKTTQLYMKIAWDNNSHFKEFLKKRNLSEEIAKLYRLGFSPKDNTLSKYFSSIKDNTKKIEALKLAHELFLIGKNERGGQNDTYDYFRDRIIFPIWDHYGKEIGFTSRAISDAQKAKYLNSKESFIFKKRDLLYGFHLAKQSIRANQSVIVVEGNMDQIALYKEGFKNSVAIMGTAIGQYSLTTLKQASKVVYLCLDNDQAGINATKRISAQFLEEDVLAKFIDLEPHKDPDEFLEILGPLEFQKRIDQSILFIDKEIADLIPEKIPESTEEKLKVLKSLYPILAPLKIEIELKARLGNISKRINLNIDLQTIFTDFSNFKDSLNKKSLFQAQNKPTSQNIIKNNDEPSEEIEKIIINKSLLKSEKLLITELIKNPELLTQSDVKELLDFAKNDEVKDFIQEFGDFIFEIDEHVYSKALLSWVNNQDYSNELSTLVGASIYLYAEIRPNEKVLLKMRNDLKFRLTKEFLKEKRINCLKDRDQCSDSNELAIHLNLLSEIDKEINEHKKQKRKIISN